MASLTDINGIGPALAKRLAAQGVASVQDLASATSTTLAKVQGLSVSTAANVIAEAKKVGESAVAPGSETKEEPPRSPAPDKAAQLEARVEKLEAKIVKLDKALSKLSKPKKKNKKSKKRKKKN